MKIPKFEVRKAVIFILTVNIIQIGMLIMTLVFSIFYPGAAPFILGAGSLVFLIVITITSLVNSFFSVRGIYMLLHNESQNHQIRETLSRVENLNNSLRAQRHDFLNHLQVVYGLMEMAEYNDARDYIARVYQDIQKISRVLKTANPAINALLQAKLMSAEKHDIHVEIQVSSRFENFPIPSWEFCRVLGNLADNAITALQQKQQERLLRIELSEDLKSFILRVEDNGPGIPENLLDKIFEAGFTTKGELGEGMGLPISKRILTKYGGTIDVKSTGLSTLFTCHIPKAGTDTEFNSVQGKPEPERT